MSVQEKANSAEAESTERREPEPLYDRAQSVSLDKYIPSQGRRLVEDVFEQVMGKTFRDWQAKIVELYGWRSGEQLQALLVYEDETRVFVGEDDTATNAGRFCFILDPDAGDPAVRTVDEALDLLRPSEVTEAVITTDAEPGRQGEWWIVPTDEPPNSSMFKPGVGSRPYGGSPLENHVPREYALGVSDSVFMERFRELTGVEKDSLQTPHDVFDWAWKQSAFHDDPLIGVPDNVPTISELRGLADGIYVKGTLRHRENDHYLERIGEQWHRAVTHDVDVYTPDTSGPDRYIFEQMNNGLYRRKTNPEWRRQQRRRRARLD